MHLGHVKLQQHSLLDLAEHAEPQIHLRFKLRDLKGKKNDSIPLIEAKFECQMWVMLI